MALSTELYSNFFEGSHQISLWSFNNETDPSIIKNWLRFSSQQTDILNETFIAELLLRVESVWNFSQFAMGFLNGLPAFCIDIEWEDFTKASVSNPTMQTPKVKFRFNPQYEKRKDLLSLLVNASLEYIAEISPVERVDWHIYADNIFYQQIALSCKFELSDMYEEDNQLIYVYNYPENKTGRLN